MILSSFVANAELQMRWQPLEALGLNMPRERWGASLSAMSTSQVQTLYCSGTAKCYGLA